MDDYIDQNITSRELDGLARRGFNALRKLVEGGESSKAEEISASATLKVLGHSSRRYGAETNRAAVAYKIIKETGQTNGMSFDRMRPMIDILVGPPADGRPKEIEGN
jgi:hypothetical protein